MIDAALFLYDLTGNMAKPWAEAGIECWCVDTQHSIRNDRKEGNVRYVWGDARSFRRPEGRRFVFAASFSPCTDVTNADARDFERKGGIMLRDAIEQFEAGRQICSWTGAPYLCENPVGVLSSLPHIGKPDFYFHPWEYAGWCADDTYSKRTCLWTGNGFKMPKPRLVTHTFCVMTSLINYLLRTIAFSRRGRLRIERTIERQRHLVLLTLCLMPTTYDRVPVCGA